MPLSGIAHDMDTFALTAAILTIAGVIAFLAHRAKQPLIIAFILVGIVVGPNVLGLVEEAEPLELLAEIGIAILLFLVGLKLDIGLVRSIGKIALLTGLGQVVFTSLIGWVIAVLFGIDLVAARWVLPWLLERLATSQELLIVWSVAWAVALAALTDVLGFSIEVGAFLAGFALASTRYRESIAACLSGLRDFLLLFFFITLGAQLDFSTIGAQVPAAIVFSLFVLIGNPLIVLVIMGVMGYPSRVGFLAGLAVAQISEFNLILIALGRDLDQIGDDMVALVTLVGLIMIAGSTYMILYSKQLYAWLAPALRIFERTNAREPESPEPEKVDAIVFGLGRYGSRVVRELTDHGMHVLAVEWDPYAEQRLADCRHRDRVRVVFGDASSPDFAETLPIRRAQWIISTVPDPGTNVVLAQSLRRHGAEGVIAVTAHTTAAAHAYDSELAAGTIDTVLKPFELAAHETLAALREVEREGDNE
ncbi:TrkA family protein [Microcella alkaliphila]|uniref:TrkA family protein n=1 Tax=Microcella alkaliphila TaxID=279828 RepID=A0A4Q7TTX4_9MICO|nr:cation:proton antiporter [Microcella alkaliphila]RZT64404.1 TrkA family protein [Microcella alkaliphila]